jgi:3-hydroxyisobutyrate dehydrogenase-like beta-hydroxyacid dehydrogenase
MWVAVLGMGRMGHALAERLISGGHTLTVWNRTLGKADDLLAQGARQAATPAEAAAGSELTLTSLADDGAVRSVMMGPDGAAAGLGDGRGVLADASTVSPQTTAQLSEVASGQFLASPILGSPMAVLGGEATYLIGGPRTHHHRARPVYETLADENHRRYVGEDPTVPSTLKLISNYLLLSGIATLAEGVATAQAAGLDDALIRGYFSRLPLVAPGLRNRLDDIISGDHRGWFPTTLGAKDVRLAEEMARFHGLQLPLADAVKRRYEEAMTNGWADADIAAVVELVRRQRTSGGST